MTLAGSPRGVLAEYKTNGKLNDIIQNNQTTTVYRQLMTNTCFNTEETKQKEGENNGNNETNLNMTTSS